MNIVVFDAIQNNETLHAVLSFDEEEGVKIEDEKEAIKILLTFDANSIEYKVVQLALQTMNIKNQDALKERIDMGEKEIKRLVDENTKIKDKLTLYQIKEDAAALSAAERKEGVLDILSTPIFIVVPPMLLINPLMGLCKILVPGSDAMRKREQELKLYQTFQPHASLTEAYNYVKNNPLKYNSIQYTPLIEKFQEEHPEGSYEEWVSYLEKKLPPPTRHVLQYTDKGPTGFQIVEECNCAKCAKI